MTNTNHCGGCTACCTIMRVDLAPVHNHVKPARCECVHAVRHGCAIYDQRPTVCRDWSCVWRGSQDRPDLRMPSNLRPDRSGVVLELNSLGNIAAHCKRPNDWRMEPMRSWLLKTAKRTAILIETGDGEPFKLEPDGRCVALEWTGKCSPEGNREYRVKR